jgi:hypothetical protein
LTGAESFGAESSIKGASFTGTNLGLKGGGALLEEFISSKVTNNGAAKATDESTKMAATNTFFMAAL